MRIRHRTNTDSYRLLKCLLVMVLAIVTLYELMRIHKLNRKKFAAMELNNEKFSDQLFDVCIGLALASTFGREFHPSHINRKPSAENHLRKIAAWFPRLAMSMEKTPKTMEETYVPYIPLKEGSMKIIKGYNHPCLLFDEAYAHDMELLHNNEAAIRHKLQFSKLFQQAASQTLANMSIPHEQFAVCVHIGRRMPLAQGVDHTMHDIVKAARSIATKTKLKAFYIFADKEEFAEGMAGILRINVEWQPNVHISTFTQVMNMYVASKLCGAVLLTERESTHGFWIGFFASKQEHVYFMQSKKSDHRRRLFLPKWKAYTEEVSNAKGKA